ncbi:hypothetical protein VB796_06700 [Arcicella sp. LKC2W]|uniref:hypothetical protein n=1 Tax=Arcicella sp. LKC2W TaxID=2984198 RepID=UPI002B21C5F5|nr:hypothetical protein [Arcicella sp. LKC2W]MEA5458717.1 hypothetical protein [Arcicella sp. LKC2W]
MTLNETLEASQILRRFAKSFENCVRVGKDIEARTYLPNIRKACEVLGMDWRALLGIENERFFTDTEPFMNRSVSDLTVPLSVQLSEQNPEITVLRDINRSVSVQTDGCLTCGNSLKGKRKGAKYCTDTCKNAIRNT